MHTRYLAYGDRYWVANREICPVEGCQAMSCGGEPFVDESIHMIFAQDFLPLFEVALKLDVYLGQAIQGLGGWAYALVGSIVFVETGFVIAPFLPGDSLVFAAGALVARGALKGPLLFVLLVVAAALGDTVNYGMGYWCRGMVQRNERMRWMKRADLERAQALYAKYGPRMIIVGRFIPVVRTLSPFVAGVGSMRYAVFLAYNVLGACLWVGVFFIAGVVLGNVAFVKDRFTIVISTMALVAMLPLVAEAIRRQHADKRARV